jgi:hypothetical protein
MTELVCMVAEHQPARMIFVNPTNPASPSMKALADAVPRLPDPLEANT